MNQENLNSMVISDIDVTGFGYVCPDPCPQNINIPSTEGQKSCPAYVCSKVPDAAGIDPRKTRRLGRVQKMAIAASSEALKHLLADCRSPERVAISVGTGLGATGQTAQFLENMISLDERQPKPGCFTNSVHNSIASQIALSFGLKGEAHTFTQDAVSFELALWQAGSILQLGRADHALACGADEISPYLLCYGAEHRWWRADAVPLSPMAEDVDKQSGTIAGEGAAAFLLSRRQAVPETKRVARIVAMSVGPLHAHSIKNIDAKREAGFISRTITQTGRTIADIEFFLFGANGSPILDAAYLAVAEELSSAKGCDIPCGVFKQFCGEYCTASAMGLAFALSVLHKGVSIVTGKTAENVPSDKVGNVLLYNLYDAGYHSMLLVTL